MSISLAIATYFIIWWTTLFAVLPFGLKTQGEAGEVVPGTPEGAPVKPHILRLFAINTVVSLVTFALVWALVRYDVIPIARLIGPPLPVPGVK